MAAHASRLTPLGLPAPTRSALPLLGLALLALALEVAPQLRWTGLAGAVCFGLAAAVRAGRARTELRAVRRAADRLILLEAVGAEGSEIVRWRTAELVAPGTRERLAHELERTRRRLDRSRLPAASPLRRTVARRQEELLRRLEERMLDGRPVRARGIVLLQRLLREPDSPLYDETRERGLGRAITDVLWGLEP